MYEFIRGIVVTKDPIAVVIEAGGIGYRVLIPQTTYDALPKAGDQTMLHLHYTLLAEQGEQRFYGFHEPRERALFRQLINVQRVGPALAMKILSAAGYDVLLGAIAGGDVAALKRVKGVGAKMAERLVVELQEPLSKLGFIASIGGSSASTSAKPLGTMESEAIQALVGLGNTPAQAEKVVTKVMAASSYADVGDVIKAALRAI